MAELVSPVTSLLETLGIGFQIVAIPLDPEQKPVESLAKCLAEQGKDPRCIVRSIVFRTGSGGFVLLAIAGGCQADWGALRRHLGERRLAMAEPEEVLAATGYPVGAVPPIALPQDVRVLVDEGVFAHERVLIASGVLGYALELASADLRLALAREAVGRFAKS